MTNLVAGIDVKNDNRRLRNVFSGLSRRGWSMEKRKQATGMAGFKLSLRIVYVFDCVLYVLEEGNTKKNRTSRWIDYLEITELPSKKKKNKQLHFPNYMYEFR